MSFSKLCIHAVIALLAVVNVPAHCKGVDIDDIVRVWRERERVIRSADVQWESVLIVTPAKRDDLGLPVPELSDELDNLRELPRHRCRAVFKGSMSRIETDIYHNDPAVEASGPTRQIITFNGEREMQFVEQSGTMEYHMGTVNANAASADILRNGHLAPILLYCRPLMPGLLSMEAASAYTLKGLSEVDGVKCYELHRASRNSTLSARLWVSADGQYLPILYEQYIGETKTLRVEVQYKPLPAIGPFPSEWNVVIFRNAAGDVMESSRGDLIDAVINGECDDSLFSIEFPPNTRVTTLGEMEKEFIIDSSGEWVPHSTILWRSRSGILRPMLVGTTFGIVVILAALVIRKRLTFVPEK